MIHRTGRADFLWKLGGSRSEKSGARQISLGSGPICCESPGIAINYVYGAKDLGRLMNPTTDWVNSKCIMIAGSNTAANHPVEMLWVLDAKRARHKDYMD